MKVTLKHAGGLAAGMRRPPRVLDTTALSAPNAKLLSELAAAAVAEDPEKLQSADRGRDGMSYTMTIDVDGTLSVLHRTDMGMTSAFAALLDHIEQCLALADGKQK